VRGAFGIGDLATTKYAWRRSLEQHVASPRVAVDSRSYR
jgi:hypothetical protein